MTRRTPRLEGLEARTLLSADVTDLQQLTIELINEARVDPPAAADRVAENMSRWAEEAIARDGNTVEGVLAEIAAANPRPPLAVDLALTEAAESHTEYMLRIGQQTHTGTAGLESPSQRAIAAGYDAPADVAENIIYGSGSPEQAMRAFLADYGATNVDNPHRENIQQTDPAEEGFQDVGVAVMPIATAGSDSQLVVTQVFARKAEAEPTLMGVVYDDADADRFYDIGEGVGGAKVTITDKATGDAAEVTTWSSGGYQAKLGPGEYQVDVHLGDRQLGTGQAVVGQDNAKLDFRVNLAARSSFQTASASSGAASRPDSTPTRVETTAPINPPASPTNVEAPVTRVEPAATRAESAPRVTVPEPTWRPGVAPSQSSRPSPSMAANPQKSPTPALVTARPQSNAATLPLPAIASAVAPTSSTPARPGATETTMAAPPTPSITAIAPTGPTTVTTPWDSDSGPDAESHSEGSGDSKQVQASPRVAKRIESLLRSGSTADGSTASKGRSGIFRGLRAWTLG